MGKEAFEDSIDNMLELDPSLDINTMLEGLPAINTNDDTKKEPKDDPKLSLKDINKVLADDSVDKEGNDDVDDEPVVDKKSKDKAPASIAQSTDDTSDAPLTVIFARDLAGQGLLSSFEEEKFLEDVKELGEAEALRNLIKTEIDANVTAARSDLDEGYQEYLRMIGKGVPAETVGNLVELKNRFDSIKEVDLLNEDNVELRKKVMTDYFKLTTSLPDSKIAKMVQTSIDLGEDIDEAKEYHNTLKSLIGEQIKAEEVEAEKQQRLQMEENKRSIELLKENINSLGEVIKDVPINKQTKNQMFESLTKPVQDNKGRTTNAIWAKRSEDPSFFDQRLAYLYATGFFEKDKPWNKLSQVKTTKEVTALEKALKTNTTSKVGETVFRSPVADKTSRDNIDAMRGIFGK